MSTEPFLHGVTTYVATLRVREFFYAFALRPRHLPRRVEAVERLCRMKLPKGYVVNVKIQPLSKPREDGKVLCRVFGRGAMAIPGKEQTIHDLMNVVHGEMKILLESAEGLTVD